MWYNKIVIKEDDLQKFNRNLNLKEIYEQIRAFNEYSIEEFFSALDELAKDNINMSKSSDKYYLVFIFEFLLLLLFPLTLFIFILI